MHRVSARRFRTSFPAGKFGTPVWLKAKLALRILVCYAVLFSPEVSLWKHGTRLLMARKVGVCTKVRLFSFHVRVFALMYSCSILNYP